MDTAGSAGGSVANRADTDVSADGSAAALQQLQERMAQLQAENERLSNAQRGEQHGEEFGKITMIRKLPAISDGDFTLGESTAILQYMAEKYRTPDHWYPADVQKRARVNEYLSWQHTAMRMHGMKIFWYKLLIPMILGTEMPKEEMDSAMEDLEESLKLVEEKFLQDRPFIAGDQISLADLVAIVEIMQPVGSGIDVFAGRPKLTAWRDRILKEIGKDLFDEAHQNVLSVRKMIGSMDARKLEGLKPIVKKKYS